MREDLETLSRWCFRMSVGTSGDGARVGLPISVMKSFEGVDKGSHVVVLGGVVCMILYWLPREEDKSNMSK